MKLPDTGERLGPAFTVDRWYDRNNRSWVVQKKDVNGNQVGEAAYVGSKREAIFIDVEWRAEIVAAGKK